MRIIELIKKNDRDFKKNLVFLFVTYFLVLFNYPLVRASTTSLFFGAYGAKSSPTAWVLAVFFLSITIFICNQLQKRFPVQVVFGIASLVSGMVFLSGSLSFFENQKIFSYVSFIWKEIYIVLQIHLILGYANSFFNKEDFRILIGPVGAFGSFGGFFGGLLTSYLSSHYGTGAVLSTGIAFVVLPLFFFFFTTKVVSFTDKPKSPLASIDTPEIKKYVLFICIMVALGQFIINIADFQFNILFEKHVPSSDLRTSYLGNIYMWTNALTLAFQFFLLPLVLVKVKERSLHLFIPISYMIALFGMILSSQFGFMPVAMLYVYFKAADYSFFSAGKEILYQPLQNAQKYGAKYLTDMLVYRGGKALIALVLIYLQSSFILNVMMMIFLLLWLIIVIQLFKLHQKLFT